MEVRQAKCWMLLHVHECGRLLVQVLLRVRQVVHVVRVLQVKLRQVRVGGRCAQMAAPSPH